MLLTDESGATTAENAAVSPYFALIDCAASHCSFQMSRALRAFMTLSSSQRRREDRRRQPLLQLRPTPPTRDVAHRDHGGLLLPDQHDQPLAASDAAPVLLATSFNGVSFQGTAEMDR
jgi:hypothetical protein